MKLDKNVVAAAGRSNAKQRIVTVPGMGALGARLAENIDVRCEQSVVGFERHGDGWLLSVQPVYADVYRWRYAQALSTFPGECLWDSKTRIGVCGDWFAAGLDGSGRVENAYLSGTALVGAII